MEGLKVILDVKSPRAVSISSEWYLVEPLSSATWYCNIHTLKELFGNNIVDIKHNQ